MRRGLREARSHFDPSRLMKTCERRLHAQAFAPTTQSISSDAAPGLFGFFLNVRRSHTHTHRQQHLRRSVLGIHRFPLPLLTSVGLLCSVGQGCLIGEGSSGWMYWLDPGGLLMLFFKLSPGSSVNRVQVQTPSGEQGWRRS